MSDSQKPARRAFDEMALGEKVIFTRTFTQADVTLFVGLTWDVNPIHSDAEFARRTVVGRRVVPGLLTASLLTHVGGLWAMLANEMHFEFLAPVFIGDTVTAEVEITAVDEGRRVATMTMRCFNQDGVEVVRGSVSGRPHRHWARPSALTRFDGYDLKLAPRVTTEIVKVDGDG